jgi:hypothetical protein
MKEGPNFTIDEGFPIIYSHSNGKKVVLIINGKKFF